MRKTIEVGDAYTFEPSCALFAEAPHGASPLIRQDRRAKVTGEVVMIHQQHHWFRVRFQLPGAPGDQHECFQLPVADTELIKYGFRQGDGRRGKYDTRYNN